ncbi:MAG: flagellar brake domain-containing protein [Eubacteriales bacterium]|nr:flagellar brake domain-containing protein [Eubacteriales bacterium]
MDTRLTIGDKIDLEVIETRLSVDPDKRPTVYVSQVLDESPNAEVLAAMPFLDGKLVPVAVGTKFNATIYSKTGLLRCEMEVTGRFKKGSFFMMELSQKTIFSKVQRRQYFRLECNIPLTYRVIDPQEQALIESSTPYDEDVIEKEWKKAVALDISGGGVRFASASSEEKGSLLQVKFDMPVGEEIEEFCLYAALLRSQQNPNKNTIYEHRVMFWKLDQTLREKLIRSIFEIQRKKRSNSN